jgi:hypothetical protein
MHSSARIAMCEIATLTLRVTPNTVLYLVIQENLARIQAAGGNGFVKRSRKSTRDAMRKPEQPAMK